MRVYDIVIQKNEEFVSLVVLVYSLNTLNGQNFSNRSFDGSVKPLNFCIYQHYVESAKYEVFSGPYVPVFRPNTGKYRPEKSPFLDTFHAVQT